MIFLNTSPYPTAEARQLVRLAFSELEHADVAVWLKACYTAPYRGSAYNGVPSMSRFRSAKACRYLVTLGVRADNIYPFSTGVLLKRAPVMEYADWRELLVAVAGHEARHIRQFKLNKPHSEVDAEKYGLRVLSRYRLAAQEQEQSS